MNIKTFKSIVDNLGKLIPGKNIIPILKYVKITVSGTFLTLTSTDIESELTIEAGEAIDNTGTIERLIHIDTLKALSKGKKDIIFSVKENNIYLNQTPCKLPEEIDIREYPAEETLRKEGKIEIENFAEKLKLIEPGYIPNGEENAIFSCLLMEYNEEKNCNIITTDGQQLLCYRDLQNQPTGKLLVNASLIPLLIKLNPTTCIPFGTKESEEIDRVQFKATLPGYYARLTTRKIERQFPDYSRAIPETNNYTMQYTKEFLQELIQEHKTKTADTDNKSTKERLCLPFRDFDQVVSLKKFEKIINLTKEEITIQNNGQMHPLVFSFPAHPNYRAILVTLRPKEQK